MVIQSQALFSCIYDIMNSKAFVKDDLLRENTSLCKV